jgi:signal transduction histidine kinase
VNTPPTGRVLRGRRARAAAPSTRTPPPSESRTAQPTTLNDVLITHKLRTRRRRKANLYQENEALRALARTLASQPEALIDSLLETALELCCAGSAGLSLFETLPDGKRIFRWVNLAGEFKPYIGGTTPAEFSPCGVTLEREAPQLFAYPEHYFQYLAGAGIPIVEGLVIPIYVGAESPGTLWIVAHDDECKFDAEDVRVLTSLAEFTAGALRVIRAYEQERKTAEEVAQQVAAQKQTEEELRSAHAHLESVVQARTAQLRQLSSRLMALQDEERRRIARDLHDSAGQYLAGIQMNLQSLARDVSALTEAQVQRLKDSLKMTDLCTSEIRTISYLLHPPLLDEVGLASALSWYAEGFSERSGIRVELQIQDDIRRLPRDMENTLFRVVQQSLANIHRHSGSPMALIKINADAENLCAEICDEGKGIPAEMLRGFHDGSRLLGVGMAGMRERIVDMGGDFDLRSSENGTTVAVRLPLPPMSQSAQA